MTCTVEQTLEALSYANRCRTARASVKRGIDAGRFNPLEVLQEPTELIEGMPLREFLMSVRGLGPKKIDRALSMCRIYSRKPIGELTQRQVWELDEKLSSQHAWRQALSR